MGKIAIDELQIGMFVHLDLGWMQHPFPVGSFRITHAQQIDKIRGLGLRELRWSPEKSRLAADAAAGGGAVPAVVTDVEAGPADAPPSAAATAPPAAERERREQLAAQRASVALCQRQFDEAGAAWSDAYGCVADAPERARTQTEGLARALLDKMLTDGDMCIRLISCNAGDAASSHAMNVAVISMLMGRVFGLPDAEMLDLGAGALMHDVGKLSLPEAVWHADPALGRDDLAAYRSHVAQGVLHGKRMGLAPGALLVIGQHHEHADGSGFPMQVKADRMATAARIVALANRYDNLCNPARLAHTLTPHEAVSLLFAQGRAQFDAGMLNAFIRMMGVYPAGSVVQLTDDRFAIVTSVNSTRPLKPNVLVHDPQTPRDEALYLNLMTTPDLGIRRSLRPSQLPPDARGYLAPRERVAYFFESVRAPLLPGEDPDDA
jgi:HD-GYP domain-containing protein (c-di-GMP phosphodiesterase class II)